MGLFECFLTNYVSNIPEMSMVVEKYDCGWKCAMNEADAKALIEKITWDVIKEKKNYAVAAKNHFGLAFGRTCFAECV